MMFVMRFVMIGFVVMRFVVMIDCSGDDCSDGVRHEVSRDNAHNVMGIFFQHNTRKNFMLL